MCKYIMYVSVTVGVVIIINAKVARCGRIYDGKVAEGKLLRRKLETDILLFLTMFFLSTRKAVRL